MKRNFLKVCFVTLLLVTVPAIVIAFIVNNNHFSNASSGHCATVNSPSPGINNFLYGVSSTSSDDAWAVGYYLPTLTNPQVYLSLIEHWDGSKWRTINSPQPSPTNNFLYGVSALSSTDAWAVGYYVSSSSNAYRTLIQHWNGSSWTIVPSPNPSAISAFLTSVKALNTNDVWAVGYAYNPTTESTDSLTLHWNGSSWTIVPSPNNTLSTGRGFNYLYGVSGFSNDVWAVGQTSIGNGSTASALIEHWNGSSWTIVPSPSVPNSTDNVLLNIAPVTSNNVLAVGYSSAGNGYSLIERWNGINWQVIQSPNLGVSSNLSGIAVNTSNDIWASGWYIDANNSSQTLLEHWDGSIWVASNGSSVGKGDNIFRAVANIPNSSQFWAVGSGSKSVTLIQHICQ